MQRELKFLNTVLCDVADSCVIRLVFKLKVKWEERVSKTMKSYFLVCFLYAQGSLAGGKHRQLICCHCGMPKTALQ